MPPKKAQDKPQAGNATKDQKRLSGASGPEAEVSPREGLEKHHIALQYSTTHLNRPDAPVAVEPEKHHKHEKKKHSKEPEPPPVPDVVQENPPETVTENPVEIPLEKHHGKHHDKPHEKHHDKPHEKHHDKHHNKHPKKHHVEPAEAIPEASVEKAREKPSEKAEKRPRKPPKPEKQRKHKRMRPQVQRSKGRIRHVNDFQKPQWHRPHLLEDLLHVLKHFDQSTDIDKDLTILTKFGVPRQGRLFTLMFYTDPMPFDFEDYVKLVYSTVTRGWGPLNTANRYLPISRYVPALEAIRYKGVKMRPDEFVEAELLKAVKRRKALEEIAPQSEDEAHIEFLKNLTIQQTSSLPLTVMHDILYNQIQIVAKLCQKYTKMLGLSSSVTKVAVAHYNLMQKHLQIFHFMGLRTMPPLYIVRKYEEEPKEENSAVTSSSSSEYAEELEDFFEEVEEATVEELKERQLEKDEENLLAGKAAGSAEPPPPVAAPKKSPVK